MRRRDNVFLAGLSGHHQHRQALEFVIGANRLEQLEAIHVRHVDIRHHEVEIAALELRQGRLSVFGLLGIAETDLLENVANDPTHGREVVNDQELHVFIGHGSPL